MTLLELIRQLATLPDEHTIYAALRDGTWTADSQAVAVEPPEDHAINQQFDGIDMKYVLEVWLANEVVETYQLMSGNNDPSVEEKLKAILYYAEHDSYLPVEDGE